MNDAQLEAIRHRVNKPGCGKRETPHDRPCGEPADDIRHRTVAECTAEGQASIDGSFECRNPEEHHEYVADTRPPSWDDDGQLLYDLLAAYDRAMMVVPEDRKRFVQHGPGL